MFKNASITIKLVVTSSLVLFLTLVCGISIIAWQSSRIAKDIAIGEARAVGEREAQSIRRQLEKGLTTTEGLAQTFTALKAKGVTDRQAWTAVIEQKVRGDKTLSGAWGVVITDELDGRNAEFANADSWHDATGQWRPYVFRKPDESLGHRPTGEITDAPDKEWFNHTYRTGELFATEPYTRPVGNDTAIGVSMSAPIMLGAKVMGSPASTSSPPVFGGTGADQAARYGHDHARVAGRHLGCASRHLVDRQTVPRRLCR
ncbi:MAG: hypothetical protein HPM95_20010 [Alphaproteobacteria bacterium]|nr:hypothetical protein [Alphaproteobacteria bacterium]